MALADQLPPFCATGQYSYAGPRQAEIILELVDQQDKVLARSNVLRPAPGTNQKWGNGCANGKAEQLIFIREITKPEFNIPSGSKYNEPVGSLSLRAVLSDSGSSVPLATSNLITYTVIPGVSLTSKIHLRRSFPGVPPDIDFDTSRAFFFGSGHSFPQELAHSLYSDDEVSAYLSVSVDFAGLIGVVGARIVAIGSARDVTALDGFGNLIPSNLNIEADGVVTGHSEKSLKFSGIAPPGTASVVIRPQILLPSGQILLFDPIQLNAESIAILSITPEPKSCAITAPANCLVAGTTTSIGVEGSVTSVEPGERVVRRVDVVTRGDGPSRLSRTTLPILPQPGRVNFFSDTVETGFLAADIVRVVVGYELHRPGQPLTEDCWPCATVSETYDTFLGASLITQTGNSTAAFVGGGFVDIQARVTQQIRNVNTLTNMGLRFSSAKADLDKWLKSAAANAAFLAISNTWSFDPPIPRDGSFTAKISLNYSAAQLPSDPNFTEARLQVISLDSSGALRVYPTTLDMVNKVATAQVDGLDPHYSLAVAGPFSQSATTLLAARTGYALVNTGPQDARLGITPYSPTGVGTSTNSILRIANQTKIDPQPAWIQAWSDLSAVEGASWLDSGPQFAVTPAAAPGYGFVFTDVEYAAGKTTQIGVANTTSFTADVTINLRNDDGTSQGSYKTTLNSKASLSANIENLFPSLPRGFVGFAVVASTQAVAASGIQTTSSTATGLAAQPMTDANLDITSRHVLRPGGTGASPTLHLVNLGASSASITLRARTTSGASAAGDVTIELPAGRQYTRSIADIFGIAGDAAASIQIDSTTRGILGDLLTADPSFIPKYAVSLPLSAAPRLSSVLPYATSSTTVHVFNPNPAATTVSVTPYASNGLPSAGESRSIPPFGSAAISSGSAGFLAISSSLPVTAAGWLMSSSGGTTGYLALPSELTVSVTASPAPAIAVTPMTLDFGTVAIGQTKDLVLTVRNNGNATLTVNSITSSNARFAPAILGTPFNVGAGSFQNATIRFSPTSAGLQTGTITIAGNDPGTPSVTINVTGTGAGSAQGPIIEVTPASLAFGTVTSGQAKDLILVVRNSGNATLTVNSITSSNVRFALAISGTPFNVGAGSFQNAIIRFSPTVAGTQSGTLTIASNDPARPSVTLQVSGSGAATATGTSTKVNADSAAAWPNGRTSGNLPPLAIDGNTTTYTWTTEALNNANPSYLGIGFGAAASVNRIRLFKDNNAGGPGLIAKNLVIEYTTTVTSTPLSSRVWTPVTGLSNGFQGAELLTATSVNSNGTVVGDSHDSLASGWASLTFNPVNATGIRIGFSNATPLSVNHYRVYEFEVYSGGTGAGTGGAGAITVTVTPSNVAPGGQVTVTWNAPGRNVSNDWVGLYRLGAATNSDNLLRPTWESVFQPSGSKTFTMPATPGDYVFHYFTSSGYDVGATSNTIVSR